MENSGNNDSKKYSRLRYHFIVFRKYFCVEIVSLGTGHYLLGWERATKLRISLAKKLWPTLIKGLKKIDPPKTQIKKL